jgi:hypothetical protein
MIDESKWPWKDAIVSYFVAQNLSEESKEKHENLNLGLLISESGFETGIITRAKQYY